MTISILIVDDEPDMCWAIAQIIESQGMNVVTAYTGEDACFKLKNGKFSIVFLDAKLPDMDGLDVAKYANTMKGEMPSIVLVSGYHYQDDPVIRQAIADGIICRFLAKPFTNEELLSILIDFLPQ
jgi:DNA-binding NtrC family response regulator